jgi:uroporphyrinogen decarboxylase
MNSTERIFLALDHKEADRVPVDFGGHLISGIHIDAYRKLLEYLGMSFDQLRIERYRQRTAVIDEAVHQLFHTDFRPLVPPVPQLVWSDDGSRETYRDEWGVGWERQKDDGDYFECRTPRFSEMPDEEMLRDIHWPDYSKSSRLAGLAHRARTICKEEKVPILDLPLGLELFDAGFNLCGSANFYMMLALDPKAAEYIMDRQLEQQLAWWTQAFQSIPDLSLIRIGDDLGAQDSMLISPEMYRNLVLPRHKKLFAGIKTASRGRAKIIMHSDGAILPVIPDLIEAGIDCLNPVQYTVPGIDPVLLKKEFGKDITFWGGGIDTQSILPNASPSQVKEEVRRQIDILAPGGGFIFSQVHIIQKDVPPENIVAMFEAVRESGIY